MAQIEKSSDFVRTLAALPEWEQRRVAVQFLAHVMDLVNDPRLEQVYSLLTRPNLSGDDLETAHTIAHKVYVHTSPWSDISELQFNCQATNFIAQALMICAATPKKNAPAVHLAQKVANYCRMAHTCSSIGHTEEGPDFSNAEDASRKIIKAQFDALEQFLVSKGL